MELAKNKFQAPSFIQGISTLKDKTLKLAVYISKEISGDEKARLFDLEQKEGWFLFSENELQEKDIPKEQAEVEVERKSPSKRLYNVLYVYWKQNYSEKEKDFDQFRKEEMELIIEDYKGKLKSEHYGYY